MTYDVYDVYEVLVPVLAGLWGAVAGAALPRAAHRFSVPVEEAEGGWRSTCPAGHPLRGWAGPARCPACATGPGGAHPAPYAPGPVSEPYPPGPAPVPCAPRSAATPYAPGGFLLPLLTAAVCAVLALVTGVRPELVVWLVLAPGGVLLAVVDVRVRRLPDELTLPLALAALTLLGPAALLPEHAGTWTGALLGAPALGGAYLLLHLISPGGLAFGDVKLALGIGAVLGWYGRPTVLLGTFAAFLLGALYGGALVVAGRAGRRTTIAFGPFMLAGAFLGLLIGAYTA